MMKYVTKPTPVDELLKIFRAKKKTFETKKIDFLGVYNTDVYNISPDFEIEGKHYIAGRVESRDSEISKVMFFERINDHTYLLNPEAQVLSHYQDPCIAFIDDEIVIGGTEIITDTDNPEKIVNWKTTFYKGKSLKHLVKFGVAPDKMKDVRIFKDRFGYGIFTRPQGHVAGPGKIGFTRIKDLSQLSPEFINSATMMTNHFIDNEWGGANEVHVLKNGLLGVLGHISKRDEQKNLHYYPMIFIFDPMTMQSTQVEIIAERRDFEPGSFKRNDLIDVLFTGGLKRLRNGKAILYTGVSDAEGHYMILDDPFAAYE